MPTISSASVRLTTTATDTVAPSTISAPLLLLLPRRALLTSWSRFGRPAAPMETLSGTTAAPSVPLVQDEDARARNDSHRWLGPTPGSAVLAGEEVGALDVGHGFGECRVAEASFHLLGGEVLDVCLDPPQVAQRVAHAPDTVAEEQMG